MVATLLDGSGCYCSGNYVDSVILDVVVVRKNHCRDDVDVALLVE